MRIKTALKSMPKNVYLCASQCRPLCLFCTILTCIFSVGTWREWTRR